MTDFSNINEYKSSTNISRLFAEAIEKKVLKSNEEFSSKPESVISLLLSGIGELSEISFFEQRMYLNEINASTAILYETLMAKLLDSELNSVFALPSSATFLLAFPKKALLDSAIVDTKTNAKHIRLNKECKFAFLSSQTFTLDHSIDIYITDYNSTKPVFKANFDLSDKTNSGLTIISNSVLNVRPTTYNGTEYMVLNVPARNMARTTYNNIINSSDIPDETYSYTNHLMGFEVLYKENANSSWVKLNGYPEGRDASDGYNYDLTNDGENKYVKIMFGRYSNSFKPSIRSELKIVIYTTDGKDGNIKIPNIDENLDNLQFYMQQDTTNVYEAAMSGIQVLCSVRSTEATGGRNQMSFEELRSYVINRGSNNKILSYADLKNKIKDYSGCSIEKVRHDFNLDIKINATLKETDSCDLISSGYGNMYFDFNEIPERSEIKARIIKPTDVFKLNSDDNTYRFQKEKESYARYVENYSKENQSQQVSFPFFIKWTNTNTINSKVFDLSANDIYTLSTSFYDAISLDNVTITNFKVQRNPSTEFPSEEEISREIEGNYFINFYAVLGDSLFEIVKNEIDKADENNDPTLVLRVLFTNKNTKQTYFADAYIESYDETNKRVEVISTLKTNNNIDDEGNICFTDYSLIPTPIPNIPTRYYYLEPTIDIGILVLFKSKEIAKNRDITYDKYLREDELEAGYYVGIAYNSEDIVLGKELTDSFNFISEVKMKNLEYQRYEEDEYEKYSSNVYEYDEKGNIKINDVETTLPDGTMFTSKEMSILHQKGEIKVNENGEKIIAHKKGDLIYNSNNKPIPKTVYADMTGIIRNFPWYDRIYNVNTKYFDIRNSYLNCLSILDELNTIIIDGITLSLSFKKTSGKSSLFYVKNLYTSELEPLDNIAISLDFGVRFDDKLSEIDKEFNINNIIEKTKEYIYNEVTDEFNINNLFSYLKDAISSITHLEHYSINNYPSNMVQTIFKKTTSTSVENEILGIRSAIDSSKSNISKNEVYFKPAITVKII